MLIEEKILALFTKKQMTLGLAESCTGGAISARLTKLPGTSDYLKGAVVSYQTSVKTSLLYISEASIKQYSVYSAEVACQMALNVQSLLQTDIALSTTGVAGPAPRNGTPVGTVYIGLATPEGKAQAFEFHFSGTRADIIEEAVEASLKLVLDQIN